MYKIRKRWSQWSIAFSGRDVKRQISHSERQISHFYVKYLKSAYLFLNFNFMPITQNFQIQKREIKEYPPLPKNIYQCQLLDVNTEEHPTYDTRLKPAQEQKLETVLNFQFTLLAGKDGEKDLRGRNVWKNFVPTYIYASKKGKNVLWRIIEACLGRELTAQEEAEGFSSQQLNALVGKQLRVAVEPKKTADSIYDNVVDFYQVERVFTPLSEKEKEQAKVKVSKDNGIKGKRIERPEEEREQEEEEPLTSEEKAYQPEEQDWDDIPLGESVPNF